MHIGHRHPRIGECHPRVVRFQWLRMVVEFGGKSKHEGEAILAVPQIEEGKRYATKHH